MGGRSLYELRSEKKGKEEKTMKKIMFVASMLIALLAFAGVSQAIIINSGPFGAKYTDFTYTDFNFPLVTGGAITTPAPGQTTPTGNVWGITSLSSIHTLLDGNPENNSLSGVAYYNSGSDGKFYFGVYGGLTYMSGTAPGEIRLGAATGITPYLKIYETTNPLVYDQAAVGGPSVSGAGAFGTFGEEIIFGADGVAGGVGANADSILWLDTTLSANTLAAYDAGFVPGELELVNNGTSVTGSAESYLDILGGTGASLFQTGVFDIGGLLTGTDRADLKIISDLTLQFSNGAFTSPFGWTTNSQDPITGVGTSVPEPSTILLLGAGLFGIGIFGRKRMKM
jgi:hypothetical protein